MILLNQFLNLYHIIYNQYVMIVKLLKKIKLSTTRKKSFVGLEKDATFALRFRKKNSVIFDLSDDTQLSLNL